MVLSAVDIVLLLAGALTILYFYITWNLNYWKKRGIASDPANPLFGHMGDMLLMKRTVGEVFTELYEKYQNEKVVGWFNFRKPSLLIRDPEIIHKILVTDFYAFRNNDLDIDESVDPILGRNIFALKDDVWKKSRALLTPAFTTGKIKPIFPSMMEVGKDFTDYLKKHPEELHVKHAMSRYTSEIVARCAFGIEGSSFTENEPVIHELGKLVFEPNFLKGLKLMSFFMMPGLSKLFRFKVIPTKVTDFFDSLLRDVIVYRQQADVKRNDLIQFLIDVKKKTIEVEKGNIQSDLVTRTYSDDDVLSGCIMFFIEAYETSAVVLNNILYLLALHPDIQERLRAEVDEVMKKGKPSFEDISEMNYLNSIILETNRLLPAGFHLQKRCTESYVLDVGKSKPLTIEKGTSIVIPLYGLHHDPQHWHDPEVFNPDRFGQKEDISAKAKGVFLPFGDGPRMCIGTRIASTVMKAAIVNIMSELEIHPCSRTPKKYEPDPTYFMLAHKGGVYLKFVPRNK